MMAETTQADMAGVERFFALAHARGILANPADHSDAQIRRACRVIQSDPDTSPEERAEALALRARLS